MTGQLQALEREERLLTEVSLGMPEDEKLSWVPAVMVPEFVKKYEPFHLLSEVQSWAYTCGAIASCRKTVCPSQNVVTAPLGWLEFGAYTFPLLMTFAGIDPVVKIPKTGICVQSLGMEVAAPIDPDAVVHSGCVMLLPFFSENIKVFVAPSAAEMASRLVRAAL